MKISEMLDRSHSAFIRMDPGQSVMAAVTVMADRGASAVLVMANGLPNGIFTEKDLIQCLSRHPETPLPEIPVESVMSDSLIVAESGDTVDEAMSMMIKADIRHLPVVDNDRVCAMVGLEDLVRCHVGTLTKELHYLKDYISNLQDAVHD